MATWAAVKSGFGLFGRRTGGAFQAGVKDGLKDEAKEGTKDEVKEMLDKAIERLQEVRARSDDDPDEALVLLAKRGEEDIPGIIGVIYDLHRHHAQMRRVDDTLKTAAITAFAGAAAGTAAYIVYKIWRGRGGGD